MAVNIPHRAFVTNLIEMHWTQGRIYTQATSYQSKPGPFIC